MNITKDLSIIIVNWNVSDLLKNCIKSIYQTIKNHSFEIIIIDNNSSDDSVQMIQSNFHDVILIKNKTNVGFAIANNQGIKVSKYKYILFLNPDTIVCENAIDNMIEVLEQKKDVGVVGPKTLNEDDTIQIDCNRNFPNLIDALRKLFLNENINNLISYNFLNKSNYYKSGYIKNIQGACMLFRREVIDTIGMFDEQYPLYLDDMDFCYRTHKAGFKIYYLSTSVIYHFKRQSSKQLKDYKKKEIMIHIATNIFFRKQYGYLYSLLHKILLCIGSIYRISLLNALILILLPIKKEQSKFLVDILKKYLLLLRYSITGEEYLFDLD